MSQASIQRVEEHAGALALAIAERSARSGRLSQLSRDVLELLTSELGLEEAAIFWCRAKERPGEHPRSLLHNIAVLAGHGVPSPTAMRYMKAHAYRALVAGLALERTWSPEGERVAVAAAVRALAVPLGTSAPWAVLVARWRQDATDDCRKPTLVRLAPSLAMALRPAHVLDEASHNEQQHYARRAIFAMSSEAILSVGEDFTIQEANPAFSKLTGWSERAVAGLRCSEVIRCRDERKSLLCDTPRCPLREAFASTGPTPVRDVHWQSRVGKLSEVSANVTVQRTGSDVRAVMVGRDVSLLNAANRMRANFISMVSHELRTPLNSVNGFLEIVLDGQVGALNERQREFLGYAHISTQQLATLVEDILLISKADSGQFTLRLDTIDVAQIVAQPIQSLQPAAEKAEVRLLVDVPEDLPSLCADELRLQQVVSNLVGNAIKFTPSGGNVSIRVRADVEAVTVSVADTGKGVPPEDHGRIFERFYQSDGGARTRAGGYGLGLAIAKLIVEQHNGRIWVESEPGLGSTFSFSIPLGD